MLDLKKLLLGVKSRWSGGQNSPMGSRSWASVGLRDKVPRSWSTLTSVKHYIVQNLQWYYWIYGFTSHSTQSASFRTRSSQTISSRTEPNQQLQTYLAGTQIYQYHSITAENYTTTTTVLWPFVRVSQYQKKQLKTNWHKIWSMGTQANYRPS